jgi:hypothetical protein
VISKRKNILFVFFISLSLILLSYSCKKDCFSTTGEKSKITIQLNTFNKLNLQNNFIIHLIQDSLNFVEIEGYKTIISNITATIKEQTLSFEDKNTCSLFKGYHKENIYIHFTQLKNISIINSPDIYSKDTLLFDKLNIENKGNVCNWDIKLKANNLQIFLHAISGEIKMSGNIKNLYLYSSGTNNCFFKNLITKNAGINHSNTGNIYLTTKEKLSLELKSNGNFYCYGKPKEVYISKTNNSKGEIYYEE